MENGIVTDRKYNHVSFDKVLVNDNFIFPVTKGIKKMLIKARRKDKIEGAVFSECVIIDPEPLRGETIYVPVIADVVINR